MTAISKLPRVGVVGVGNMGGGMARRLLSLGGWVGAHDLDHQKTQHMQSFGAQVLASARDVAINSEVVILCVVDAPECWQVLQGPAGLLAGLRAGQTVILCPTIAPEDVAALAVPLLAAGVRVIDAPMSGGPARALDGSMSLMVACAQATYEQHLPLLQALSSRLFFISERLGDGARTKLVNNLLAGINLAGAAEVMALALRLGLDGATTLAVIGQSSGQSWIGNDRMQRALANDYAPRAHMTLLAKDTGLAVAAAQQAGFEGLLGPMTSQLFRHALDSGLASEDDAALLKLLRNGAPKMGA